MFQLALKARIPIIRATTADLVYLPEVLARLNPPGYHFAESHMMRSVIPRRTTFYAINKSELFNIDIGTYSRLAENGSVLVLVNSEEPSPYAFDAGEIPVPQEMVVEMLKSALGKEPAEDLLVAIKGLTLKVLSELIRLSEASGVALTPRSALNMRHAIVGALQGLQSVSLDTACYIVPEALKKWLAEAAPFFLTTEDSRLMPRGLLFDGTPGTGKSMAAKHIAKSLGVPLYRFDIGGALSKWHGESEERLSRMLALLDREEPCVLLLDEIEKMFSGSDDSGVTSRLLGQLLWWLQEHRSRVLTVMTTNNLSALPVELYRPGRIDHVMTFKRVPLAQISAVAATMLKAYPGVKIKISDMAARRFKEPASYAAIEQFVRNAVREAILRGKDRE